MLSSMEYRFTSKYEVDDNGCHVWQAAKWKTGYPIYTSKAKMVRAHRYAWEQVNGPIPDGMVIDHLCRVPACVNPEHMEVVTHQENILRGVGPSAINARKTHCMRGHEFTDENTRRYQGRRHCRKCACIHAKRARDKR